MPQLWIKQKNNQHFGLTNNQLQAGSPFLAAEDALQEIARCDKIMIMWYSGHSSSVYWRLGYDGVEVPLKFTLLYGKERYTPEDYVFLFNSSIAFSL